ncbi:MAG: electron transfer flavoprotein subunit beta/FixA family protein [Haloarculaceae archaeon]
MKILTTATEVAVVDDEFEVDGDRIDERYLSHELNEWDEYAIEEAVQVGEAHEDAEVVVASIGPERAEEVIRQALAKGADRAIRVWDEALAERPVLDTETKARVLAAIAEEVAPDLVLTGVQTGDHAWGATGVALARELGYQWAAVVSDLELDGEVARVHRELEGGVEEVVEVDLPAVLTIQSGINEPRYASLRGIRQAQSKPLDVRSLSDLGVDVGDGRLSLREMYEPEAEGDTEYVEGSPEEQAARLVEIFEDAGVIDA